MVAAKPLPEVLVDIDILAGGTVSDQDAYKKVGIQASIAFTNNAGFPINIVFTNTFDSIEYLENGDTSDPQSTSQRIALNYVIQNADTDKTTGGPYAIQFADGALPISICKSNTDPDPVAIPPGGSIAFSSDEKYSISWKFKNGGSGNGAWNPQKDHVEAGQNEPLHAQASGNGKELQYELGSTTILTQGGGTVKVGS